MPTNLEQTADSVKVTVITIMRDGYNNINNYIDLIKVTYYDYGHKIIIIFTTSPT